jgi:hypothetical protein
MNLYEDCTRRIRRLINARGRHDLAVHLAVIDGNKGTALLEAGNPDQAFGFLDAAIGKMEEIAQRIGPVPLAHDLARTYANRAMGFHRVALMTLYDAGLFEAALSGGLAPSGPDTPTAGAQDLLCRALADYDRALATYQPVLHGPAREQVVADYTRDQIARAQVLWFLGDQETAIREGRAAVRVLRAEVQRTGRIDLHMVIQSLSQSFPAFLNPVEEPSTSEPDPTTPPRSSQ